MQPEVGQRVVIIGPSCSGKSTLGERLAELTGSAHIELDALHWEPGWRAAGRDLFRERVRIATEPNVWILSGSYISQQQDVSWPRADTVVWLDLPLWLTLPRILTRSWRRSRRGELLWGTNEERFWPQLKIWDPDASLIAYSLRTYRSRRARDAAQVSDPRWEHIRFVRLRSSRQVERWVAAVAASVARVTAPTR